MERLWTDRARLVDLSRRAYARIRAEFSPALVARRRAALYEELIATFQRDRMARLATLPAKSLGAILPALSALTGVLAGVDQPDQTPCAPLLRSIGKSSQGSRRPSALFPSGAGQH